MTAIPSSPWYDSPEEWNALQLGARTIPGWAEVRVRRGNKWDRQIAKGEHGEDQKYGGTNAADVDITIRLRNSAEILEFETLLPDIEPDPGKAEQKAYDIVHPVTSIRKVRAVCIDDIDGPEIEGQEAIYRIKCFEHRPRTSKNASGKANGGGVVSNECADLLRLHQDLLSSWATAGSVEETAFWDNLIDTNYQALRALGCEDHAPPSGEQVGYPEQTTSPLDSVLDFFGF